MATFTGSPDVRGRPPASPPAEMAGRPVASSMSSEIADPVPLGLAGFGLTTLALSVVNAGWIDHSTGAGVLALAIAFGGGAQFLAGMWAFRAGRTFAATAFSGYGAFWISYWLLTTFFVPQIARTGSAGAVGAFVGLYLFLWGIFTTYMLIASLAGSKAVTGVFLLLALTYFCLCIGAYWSRNWWTYIGGYLGILTAVNALYVSFADVTNASFKRHILPT
jgi:succinate-acetate transporter protein